MSTDAIAARLVRADQLIEEGNPLGELMQVQCELARDDGDRARRIALRRRERALSFELDRHWLETVLDGKHPRYRLGAVDAIMTGVPEYVRDRDALFARAPELRHVGLWGLRHKTGQSVRDPDAWTIVRDMLEPALDGRIKSLGVFDTHIVWNSSGSASFDHDAEVQEVADEIAAWLIASKHLASLQGLELSSVTPQTLRRLASAPEAAHLDELVLKGTSVIDASVLPALCTTKLAPRRIVLTCYAPGETDERFLASPFVERATELEVPRLQSLAVGPKLRKLTTTLPEDAGWLSSVANAPSLGAIEELAIQRDGVHASPVDVSALRAARRLESLRVLRLHNFGLSLADVRALLRSPLGRQLEVLDVSAATTAVRDAFHAERAEQEWDGIVVL